MHSRRMQAELPGDFVVFLIGMRINRWWAIHRWLPVFLAMPRMLRELGSDSGLLASRTMVGWRTITVVQYWESFEDLHGYARDRTGEHVPAWVSYNRRVGEGGPVGIWHETYLVRDGEYENVYNNMPAYGLGEAGTLSPATGRRRTAMGRLGRTDGDDAPVSPDGTVDAED